MLFKNEPERLLKQEIIAQLSVKTYELKQLAQDVSDYYPLGGLNLKVKIDIRSDEYLQFGSENERIIQPGVLLAVDLLALDSLSKRLVTLINDRDSLLEAAQNRLAKVRTGNLKQYIQDRLPDDKLALSTHSLIYQYKLLHKMLKKWNDFNFKERPGVYKADSKSAVQFHLMKDAVAQSLNKDVVKQLPDELVQARKKFLKLFKDYTDATRELAEKNTHYRDREYASDQIRDEVDRLNQKDVPLKFTK